MELQEKAGSGLVIAQVPVFLIGKKNGDQQKQEALSRAIKGKELLEEFRTKFSTNRLSGN
ncbi:MULTISPECIES: hypothetical protein [Bacillaceae]|uniref:hypothetical protein n=1 Tax=Bacillaceae TaxID=186817 RepID=UPI002FFFD51B